MRRQGKSPHKGLGPSSLVGNGVSLAQCGRKRKRGQAGGVLGWMVMIFTGLRQELRLHLARERTHTALKHRSDKATFVRWSEG